MHQIQLSDQLYQQAKQRATEAGFQSVDEYIADIVESDVSASVANFDHFFTPEVVSHLNQIHAEVLEGARVFSQEEVDEFFRQKSQAWREAHGN
jgi:hypothetical protein